MNAASAIQYALDRPANQYQREESMRQGQAAMRTAVAPLPPRRASHVPQGGDVPLSQGVPQGGVTNARVEVERAILNTRKELDDLLGSVGTVTAN